MMLLRRKKKNRSFDSKHNAGLVFLIYRNETKRALLPNEITAVDTVHALFVRSFPDQLNLTWFNLPGRKVYVLDQSTSVFYELEDLRDVKDRTVLKVYETDGPVPLNPSPTRSPLLPHDPRMAAVGFAGATSGSGPGGYESDSSVRSAPAGPCPRSPGHLTGQARPYSQEVSGKAIYGYQGGYVSTAAMAAAAAAAAAQSGGGVYGQAQAQAPPPPSHWSPTHRGHSCQQHHYLQPTTRSNQSSPQRTAPLQQGLPLNQRHSLAYLPDPAAYQDAHLPQSRSYHDYHDNGSARSSGSVTPTHDVEAQCRMAKMEAQLANLAALVQTAVKYNKDGTPVSSGGLSRPSSARSTSSIVSDASSAKSNWSRNIQDPNAIQEEEEGDISLENRARKTPLRAHAGMSDISSSTPQPVISLEMHHTIRTLHIRARDLRSEVTRLRRMQVANMDIMRDTINDTYTKLKEVICSVPGASDLPVRSLRQHVDSGHLAYNEIATRIQDDLHDLEAAVEEIRGDVINKKCRVNLLEVENMALALSKVAKQLGDLKAQFPVLQDQMKSVMQGEMQIVVQEERFLKDEPDLIDNALRRCKKLTGTLSTLKRLAMVQEQKGPEAPPIRTSDDPDDEDRLAILENIKAIVPDHSARLQSMEAVDQSRERKKKLTSNSDTLRFEKTLALAQKQLRETNNLEQAEQRYERVLNGLFSIAEASEDKSHHASDEACEGRANGRGTVDQAAAKQPGQAAQVKNGKCDSKSQENGSVDLNEPLVKGADDGSSKGGRGSEVRVQGQGSPPEKPPRTMTYQSPEHQPQASTQIEKAAELVKPVATPSTSSSGATASNAAVEVSPSPSSSQLSNFGHLTHSINSSIQSLSPGGKSPLSPPPSTSTPKVQSHVTFCPAVTEIKGGVSPNLKPKKIPPPPPPRKSSFKPSSPSDNNTDGPPPVYENIENLNIHAKGPGARGKGQAKGQRPKSVSDLQPQNVKKIPPPTRPKSHYANVNELHGQSGANNAENTSASVNSVNLSGESVGNSSNARKINNSTETGVRSGVQDTDSSSSASLDSQQGTLKRATNPGLKSPPTSAKGRKIPPPPPVRKSSALTTTVSPAATDPKSNSNTKPNGSNGTTTRHKSDDLAKSPPSSTTSLQAQYQKLQQLQKEHLRSLSPPSQTHSKGVLTPPKDVANGQVASKAVKATKTAAKTNKLNGEDGKDKKAEKGSSDTSKDRQKFEETEIY